jgi:hypothetical protein
MKNNLIFDLRDNVFHRNVIYILNCECNKLIHKIFINSIGVIEIRKTVANILNTDIILDNIYIENLISNDIDVVKMTIEIIFNKYNLK